MRKQKLPYNNLTVMLYLKYGSLIKAYADLPLSAPTIINARNGIYSEKTKMILEKEFGKGILEPNGWE